MDDKEILDQFVEEVVGENPALPKARRKKPVLVLLILLVLACGVIAALGLIDFTISHRDQNVVLRASELTTRISSANAVPRVTEPSEDTMALTAAPPEVAVAAASDAAATPEALYAATVPGIVAVTGDGAASGLVLTADGYVLAPAHILAGDAITVTLEGGSICDATLLSRDDSADLAVLKIDAQGLEPVEFADSGSLTPGDAVTAFARTAEGSAVTADGQVSALAPGDGGLLQITADCTGFAGGALVNAAGQVVGLLSDRPAADGAGSAIPVSQLQPALEQLLEKAQRSAGVVYCTIPAAARAYYHLPDGIYILQADPSAGLDLAAGDVIIAADGEPVTDLETFSALQDRYDDGNPVTLTVSRQGQVFNVVLLLQDPEP